MLFRVEIEGEVSRFELFPKFVDYRFILLLRDASLYNKQKTALKKKPTQAKARTKLAKPGTSNRIKPTSSVKKAQQRVAKTGKVSDAANYFEKII